MRRSLWMIAAMQLTCATTVRAQAWVPAQGEGTVTLTYQNYYVTGHFDVMGRRNTNGATHAKTMVADLDVAVTDTIGLTVSLPFVVTKYTGPSVYFVGGHPTYPGPLDDGSYHGAFQDVRVEARRMWWAGPIPVAPFVGVSVPTHQYETHGEAVAGRGRRELALGASAAADLSPILPRTYVHARYALLTGERQHGFPSVRSLIDLESGYDLSSIVGVRGLATWQIKHQGPTIPELAAHDWPGHDRFVVANYFNVGGGVTLSVKRSTELHAVWVATVSGNSGAHVARMLSVGATWSFGNRIGGFDERSGSPIKDAPSQ